MQKKLLKRMNHIIRKIFNRSLKHRMEKNSLRQMMKNLLE